jgi:hypothetical protein
MKQATTNSFTVNLSFDGVNPCLWSNLMARVESNRIGTNSNGLSFLVVSLIMPFKIKLTLPRHSTRLWQVVTLNLRSFHLRGKNSVLARQDPRWAPESVWMGAQRTEKSGQHTFSLNFIFGNITKMSRSVPVSIRIRQQLRHLTWRRTHVQPRLQLQLVKYLQKRKMFRTEAEEKNKTARAKHIPLASDS